jgi:hypothetical protein
MVLGIVLKEPTLSSGWRPFCSRRRCRFFSSNGDTARNSPADSRARPRLRRSSRATITPTRPDGHVSSQAWSCLHGSSRAAIATTPWPNENRRPAASTRGQGTGESTASAMAPVRCSLATTRTPSLGHGTVPRPGRPSLQRIREATPQSPTHCSSTGLRHNFTTAPAWP